jgi:hypothetical protein
VTKEENRDGIKKTEREREREIEKRIRLAGDLI